MLGAVLDIFGLVFWNFPIVAIWGAGIVTQVVFLRKDNSRKLTATLVVIIYNVALLFASGSQGVLKAIYGEHRFQYVHISRVVVELFCSGHVEMYPVKIEDSLFDQFACFFMLMEPALYMLSAVIFTYFILWLCLGKILTLRKSNSVAMICLPIVSYGMIIILLQSGLIKLNLPIY